MNNKKNETIAEMILQIWITKKIIKLDFQNVKNWNPQKMVEKWYTKRTHKNHLQELLTKIIHKKDSQKIIHKNDTQKWFTKVVHKSDSKRWFKKMI